MKPPLFPTLNHKLTYRSRPYNQYSGKHEFKSQPAPLNGGITRGFYQLVGILDKNSPDGRPVHQIRVTVLADSWVFLDSAYANGQELRFVKIDREVGLCSTSGCRISKTVGINLLDSELVDYSLTGLSFQMSGQRARINADVPAQYFAGYNSKVKSVLR